MTPEDRRALLDRAPRDPSWFVRHVLGDEPWAKQVEILESIRDHRETVVKSCHSGGKSFIGARAALWFAATHRPSMVITTAPTDRQVRGIMWKEIRSAYSRSRVPLGGRILSQDLHFDDGWSMIGFTAPEYDESRFQGFHSPHILAIIDEAAGVSSQIVDAVHSLLSSGDMARLLMLGNPTDPTSAFAAAFKKPGVSKISISAFDTPNFTGFGITDDDMATGAWTAKITGDLPAPHLVTPEWVADRRSPAVWGPQDPRYVSRVLAKFPEETADTLIPMHWIDAARDRELKPGNSDATELGCDIARFGTDDSVLMMRRGPVARLLLRVHGHDTMQVTGAIAKAMREIGASRAKVDEIGVGSGVTDRLKELGIKVDGINVGQASRDPEQYANLRAELAWGLRKRFEAGDIALEGEPRELDELATQLNALRYKLTSRGQVQLEAKEETKKRLGRSPDDADALMLAFAPSSRVVIR